MLREAMCKMMGFIYAPNEEHYWNHSYSTESDFIYVTTQPLDDRVLETISNSLGDRRSLLICFLLSAPKRMHLPT